MDALSPTAGHVAAIYNAAWMVRHHARGARIGGPPREHRAQAVRELGMVVRQVFAASEDFEPLLAALVDGLSPRTEEPRF